MEPSKLSEKEPEGEEQTGEVFVQVDPQQRVPPEDAELLAQASFENSEYCLNYVALLKITLSGKLVTQS